MLSPGILALALLATAPASEVEAGKVGYTPPTRHAVKSSRTRPSS